MVSKSNARLAERLRRLSSDYRRVTGGATFAHFFCPILQRDEGEVELCQGHVVNEAFRVSKAWIVQRKDVDGFFGRNFESDFVALKDKGKSVEEVLADATLSRLYKPTVQLDGQRVDYYVPTGHVPDHHSRLILGGPTGQTHVALKMPPAALAKSGMRLQVEYSKDIRIPALVSLLKAAHLTLFRMLGYAWALSAGGRFLGHEILGRFFLVNEHASKDQVLANAVPYFREFAHMMRPVMGDAADRLDATLASKVVYLCQKDDALCWGLIVLVRTGAHALHAVLVPILDGPRGRQAYLDFLQGSSDEQITSRPVLFAGDHWEAAVGMATHVWPKTGLLYPEMPVAGVGSAVADAIGKS